MSSKKGGLPPFRTPRGDKPCGVGWWGMVGDGVGWWGMWCGMVAGGHKKINATNHLAFIYVFCSFIHVSLCAMLV